MNDKVENNKIEQFASQLADGNLVMAQWQKQVRRAILAEALDYLKDDTEWYIDRNDSVGRPVYLNDAGQLVYENGERVLNHE